MQMVNSLFHLVLIAMGSSGKPLIVVYFPPIGSFVDLRKPIPFPCVITPRSNLHKQMILEGCDYDFENEMSS